MPKTVSMEWLVATKRVHGLENDEFDGIREFTLLWGLFESAGMGTRGSQNEVVATVVRMPPPDPLPAAFAAALSF